MIDLNIIPKFPELLYRKWLLKRAVFFVDKTIISLRKNSTFCMRVKRCRENFWLLGKKVICNFFGWMAKKITRLFSSN